MTEKNKHPETAYASLTGWRRAVPIVLGALAVFAALCFITKDTGAMGHAISSVLLGLFSIGGYFIPALLLIHAMFYPSDVRRKRVISRIIFSFIAVVAIASLVHAVTYWNSEQLLFKPAEFYKNGTEGEGGGFIGGILAFSLIKLFGSVGVVIITVLIFALYITYFFNGAKSKIAKFLLRVIDGFGAVSERMKKSSAERKEKRAKQKEERKAEELAAEQDSLIGEEFSVPDGYSDITIKGLGIQITNGEGSFSHPLMNEVPDGDVYIPSKNPPRPDDEFYDTPVKNKRYTGGYTMFNSSVEDMEFEPRDNDIIVEEAEDAVADKDDFASHFTDSSSNAEKDILADSADDVFGKGFDAYDLKLASELANKPSSKRAEDIGTGIGSYEKPVYKAAPADAKYSSPKAPYDTVAPAPEKKDEAPAEELDAGIPEREIEFDTKPLYKSSGAELYGKTTPIYAPKNGAVNEEKKDSSESADAPEGGYSPAFSNLYSQSSGGRNTYRNAATFAMNANGHYADENKASTDTADSKNGKSGDIFTAYKAPTADELLGEEKPDDALITKRSSIPPRYIPDAAALDGVKNDGKADKPESDGSNAPEEGGVQFIFNGERLDGKKHEEKKLSDTAVDFTFEESEDKKNGYIEENSDSDADSDCIEDADEEDEGYNGLPPEEDIFEEDEIPEEEQSETVKKQRNYFTFFGESENEDGGEEEDADSFDGSLDGELEEEDHEEDAPKEDEFCEEFDGNEDADDFEDDGLPPFTLDEEMPDEKDETPPPPPKKPKPDYSNYVFPPLSLLTKGKEEDLALREKENIETSLKLVDALEQFNISISIKGIDTGPRITRFEVLPGRGVSVKQIQNKENDIALALAAESLRIEAPVPGKAAVGIEVPNKRASLVWLRDLLETSDFQTEQSKTIAVLGRDVTGVPQFIDIAKMPHLLVAGATGMGKSVAINAILLSILYKARPDEVKLILIDPKNVEFTGYNGIPHLLVPVVTDIKQASGTLMWAVEEMNKRYGKMAALEVRQLDSYNKKVMEDPTLGDPIPKIIIVIDELNDIMLTEKKNVEQQITSITQKARAAGIHLIIGTQRPSVDVITGVIKANIPSRISCHVASAVDSKTILDFGGAEKLLDKGDMLFTKAGLSTPRRAQGAFVSDEEVTAVMKHLKAQAKGDIYDEEAIEDIKRATKKCIDDGREDDGADEGGSSDTGLLNDPVFLDAVEVAFDSEKISTSLLQRRMSIGYGKAARLIDAMTDLGIVSPPNGQKPREVLLTRAEWHEMLERRGLT